MRKTLISTLFLFLVIHLFAQTAATSTPVAENPKSEKMKSGGPIAAPVDMTTGQTGIVAAAQAQVTASDGPIYESPETFFDQGTVGALIAGVMSLIAYLSGFIKPLRSVNLNFVRSGAVIFVLLAGLATFKEGALTPEFFDLLTSTFIPNFAYSALIYEAFKAIVKLINRFRGGDTTTAPATPPLSAN